MESLQGKDLSQVSTARKRARLAELESKMKRAQEQSIPNEQPEMETSFTEGVIRDIPEIAGSTIGSMIGTALPIPGGRLAGAYAGGMVGNLGKQMFEQGNVPPLNIGGVVTPGISNYDNTSIDMNRAREAGKIQATGELAGGIIGKVGKALLPYTKSAVKEGANIASDWFRQYGGKLTTAQLTDAWLPDFMQNIAKSGWLSGGRMAKFAKEAQEEPMETAMNAIKKSIGKEEPVHQFGETVKNSIIEGDQSARAAASKLYSKVDELWDKPIVDYKVVKELAQDIVDTRGVGETGAATNIAKKILKRPDTVTFLQAHNDRSSLLAISRAQKELMSSNNMRQIRGVAGGINDSINSAGESLGSFNLGLGLDKSAADERAAFEAWKRASKFYKENVGDVFDVEDIRKLVNKNRPDEIARSVFLPNNPKYIKQLERAVGNPETFESMKASWFSNVLDTATNPETGQLSFKKVLTSIKKMGSSYDVMFTKEQREAQNKLFNIMRMIEEKPAAKGAGSVFIQLKQAGAVTGTAGAVGAGLGGLSGGGQGAKEGTLYGIGTGLAGSTLIFLSPVLAGHILTSPTITNYLATGIREGTPQAIEEITRMLGRITASGSTPPSQP